MKASASGDIKVGTYVFKLTVKDVEELTSSAVLNVDVKQGTSHLIEHKNICFRLNSQLFLGVDFLTNRDKRENCCF